jgi:anti-anti-sigma factor
MEITSERAGSVLAMHLRGRLDGYWADHLSHALDEALRDGHYHIRLDLTEVGYLSSLGIRVLVTFYKKLRAIGGTLAISDASDLVGQVLETVGLRATLMPGRDTGMQEPAAPVDVSRTFESRTAAFEVYDLGRTQLSCEGVGEPGRLEGCRFSETDCHEVAFPLGSFGVGLGALGQGFTECRERFGEFLAVAGAAAYLPTDGSNVPDFQIAEGLLVPKVQMLYGAVCSGSPSALARFETRSEHGAVGMAELAETALEISGAERAGVICVAESSGLVGASLRRSPVEGDETAAPFSHPGIREWLSFTTEPAYSRALAVVVGIAARTAEGPQGPLLRALREDGVHGHFHAAAFSYRPLQKGRIDLEGTVRALFEDETLEGILHLIGDDRDAVGVSESEFVRGACWIGPIAGANGHGARS